jgi:hypothetical protein
MLISSTFCLSKLSVYPLVGVGEPSDLERGVGIYEHGNNTVTRTGGTRDVNDGF